MLFGFASILIFQHFSPIQVIDKSNFRITTYDEIEVTLFVKLRNLRCETILMWLSNHQLQNLILKHHAQNSQVYVNMFIL